MLKIVKYIVSLESQSYSNVEYFVSLDTDPRQTTGNCEDLRVIVQDAQVSILTLWSLASRQAIVTSLIYLS